MQPLKTCGTGPGTGMARALNPPRWRKVRGWAGTDPTIFMNIKPLRWVAPIVNGLIDLLPGIECTHREIARDAWLALGKPERLKLRKLLQYASYPDQHDISYMAYHHYYNPEAAKNGEVLCGGGPFRVATLAKEMGGYLKKGDSGRASYVAALLQHYMADICVPWHTDGGWTDAKNSEDGKHPLGIEDLNGNTRYPVGWWTSKHLLFHAMFEMRADLKVNKAAVVPNEIRGGLRGIVRRYKSEARVSRRAVDRFLEARERLPGLREEMKVHRRKLKLAEKGDTVGPLKKSVANAEREIRRLEKGLKLDTEAHYLRAVQLVADVWHTILLSATVQGEQVGLNITEGIS